ncbi:hypothetical protein N431DRAFT_471345 [Stipitochalara longipes BDJ]|nr:hypothetical protein N431DRAFT_471345 [Stipitochalara longipes BDJ]
MSNYNLGPLTTTFTPAATCTVPVIACSTCSYGWAAQTCFSGGIEDYTACWPGTSSGVPAPTPPLQGWGFYSPGLLCPQGYASACGAVETAAGTWKPQFPLQTGETAVGCCPSGYACTTQASGTGTCALVATSTGIAVSTCSAGKAEPVSTVAIPLTVTSKLEASSFTVYAPLIQLVYQKSDVAAPSISSSGTNSTKSKATATTSPSKNSTTTSASAPIQTSSLIGYTPGSAPSVTQNVQSSSTSGAPSTTNSTPSSGVSIMGSLGIKRYIALGGIAALFAFML